MKYVKKKINRELIVKLILSLFLFIISFNLFINIAFSREEFPSGFTYSDQVKPNETVNYHFSNFISLSLRSNVQIDLNIEYENRIQDKQIGFIINNSDPISLNLTSKTKLGNFAMDNAPQAPRNQFQNNYDCFFLLVSNISIEKITIRNYKEMELGLNPDKEYSLALYSPTMGESWELLETTEVFNETASVYYLETDLLNLRSETEYYLTYFEFVPAFDPWFLIIVIVSIVGVASALLFLISRSDYFDYLKQRTIPIEKGAHRLSLDEVLENDNRNKIIDLVLKEPGIHFNELLRQTGLAAGNLVWHLDILETYKVIGKKRVGKFIAYFPYYQKNPLSNLDIKLSKSKLTLEILEMIEDQPGLWNNLITKKLKVDHKTIQYHINKLKDLNLVRFRKEGRKKKIYPNLEAEYFESKNGKN